MESRGTETEGDFHTAPDQAQATDRHWLQRRRGDTIMGNIQNTFWAIYNYLMSSDFIWQSLQLARKNMAEAPCSTMLYIFMGLFGLLPIVCFCLFVCATLILWLVCFIFCQAIAVTFAGAICAVMFSFIIAASCIMATAFGMTVHTMSFMGRLYRVMAFNAPEAVSFVRQQLERFGIHLRLPEDDQL